MFVNWSAGDFLLALALTYFAAGYLEYLHKDAKKDLLYFFSFGLQVFYF